MRIISRRTLREFWVIHPDAERPLQAWYANVKATYQNASFIENNRVVFNIKGNSYRLIVAINYQYGIVYIRFVGTHQVYDKIDVTTI
ncbi:MAG: type II toxin-antitoxin system HigB family toxin [Candidatus Poribacteria bacterium]|nr:type II toxin-antitoxin system HigB family toxin [Candidatus Poribacteria bacterium]